MTEAQELVQRCLRVFSEKLEGYDPRQAIFNLPYNVSTPELERWRPTPVRAFRTGSAAINRHVVFSNIIVRDSNKVFGINVQDGATVSDVRFVNVTFETNRRHGNGWGSAEVMRFVLKKRTPDSRLGRIQDITIDGAQGTARGTSLVFQGIDGLTLRNVEVLWAREAPEPQWGNALVLRGITGLVLEGFRGEAGRLAGPLSAIRKGSVTGP